MDVKDYKDLIVWQKAMELAREIYKLARKLPKEEMYGLSNQIRRSAVSIPSNIAEGHSRNSRKEFIQFLSIAKGSKSELETQLILCRDLGYFEHEDIENCFILITEVGKMLNGLMKKLTPNP